jgi:hypothetical protein
VIEYLLARARRSVEPISGFMLYSMARDTTNGRVTPCEGP